MENNNRFMPHIRRTVVFLLRVLQHTGLSDPYVIQVYCLNNSNC